MDNRAKMSAVTFSRILNSIFYLFLLIVALNCSVKHRDEGIYFPESSSRDIDDSNNDGGNTYVNDSIGRLNAIKKAYQLTDLKFTPLNPISSNYAVFTPGVTYESVIYSSAKELETFVGNDISIHTFMTAIHNPRSKIYTEDISKPPYHGNNCRAYYGTICSAFVSYALGIEPRYWTDDFTKSHLFAEVDLSLIDSIELADVLWKKGHVALITQIEKDSNGVLLEVEVSESIGNGCRKRVMTREQFLELMNTTFTRIYRYKEIYKNVDYTPAPQFVAVGDEVQMSYHYNEDLCVDKGDQSCYLEGEPVIINIMHSYDHLEVYKNNELYSTISDGSKDVELTGYPFGDYKARIKYDNGYSDFTYWKVVSAVVSIDKRKGRILFDSANAEPLYLRFCDIAGSGGLAYTHVFTEEEINSGYIDMSTSVISQKFPYVRVIFQTQYGKIISIPINWFDER